MRGAQTMIRQSILLSATLCIVLPATALGGGTPPPQIYYPIGITEPRPFYFPNAFADPTTGMKTGWYVPNSTKTPKYGMWQNQEHAIMRTGPNHWLIVAMEMNRIYFQPPDTAFTEAYKFLEYDDGIMDGETTPTFQAGYWRGDTLESHPYVWAPTLIEDGGTYYLFFTAADPTERKLDCYLATSTTGSANPSDWVEYDPNPSTPEIDPIFGDTVPVKDFNVLKVQTDQGPRFYCYYIRNPDITDPRDSTNQIPISQVCLRISDNLYDWQDKPEKVVFDRLNVGITDPDWWGVDYENPEVVQLDNGVFYLLVSRHGSVPADYGTNPNWVPIPLATEVYWSTDGLSFPVDHQLPNLTSPSGRQINAAEYVRVGSRWFATDAVPSNNPDNYELTEPYDNPTSHSDLLLRILSTYTEPENSLQIMEMQWAPITAAGSWVYYQ